jgi:dephospho-CoA kinase
LTTALSLARLVAMKVIGLTGGIGSGKSTVSRFLAELGAVVIDADKVSHEAFKQGTELYKQVVSAFGKEVLTPEKEIDRARLGEIVFADAGALARLNSLVHPMVYKLVKSQLDKYRRRGEKVVVLEVPLLIDVLSSKKAGEPALINEVDEVWVTVASEDNILKRLKKRGGMADSESLARIRSQLPAEERLKYADVIITNDGDISGLRDQVEKLWRGLLLDTE